MVQTIKMKLPGEIERIQLCDEWFLGQMQLQVENAESLMKEINWIEQKIKQLKTELIVLKRKHQKIALAEFINKSTFSY